MALDNGQLFRVYGAFAGHAEFCASCGLAFEAIHVLEVEPRYVDEIDLGFGGCMDKTRARVQQGIPGRRNAQLRSHVGTAEQQCVDARARPRNLVAGFEPLICFDDKLQPSSRPHTGQQFIEQAYFIRRFDLG